MTVQHLADCDLRHNPRQRCSSWQPPPGPPPIEQSPAHGDPPRTARRALLGCAIALFAPFAVLLTAAAPVVAFAFFRSPTDFIRSMGT